MTERETTIASPRGDWPLAGSVKPYHRHAFACTGDRSWPGRLEEDAGLLGTMAREVKELRCGDGPIPKLTATDEPSIGRGIDLLVFPEAVRYRVVDPEGWRAVLNEHLLGGSRAEVESEPLPGRHVFVCVHAARDERCGRCGPPLLAAITGAVERAGIEDVTVRATSHVGGHKYAGNVLIYPEGVWYGYVRPQDAERLVRDHLFGGRTLEDLHRGSMLGAVSRSELPSP